MTTSAAIAISTAIEWRNMQLGTAVAGFRGEQVFYRIFPKAGAEMTKFSLESVMPGSGIGRALMDSMDAAKAYAELDFANWARRCKLRAA